MEIIRDVLSVGRLFNQNKLIIIGLLPERLAYIKKIIKPDDIDVGENLSYSYLGDYGDELTFACHSEIDDLNMIIISYDSKTKDKLIKEILKLLDKWFI